MKKNDFPYFTTRFFESYLPGSRNVSENMELSRKVQSKNSQILSSR